MPSPAAQQILEKYIRYYETMTRRSIRLIEKLAEPGMAFKDPFNDVVGIEAVEAIFEHMFASVQNPKFRVRDYGWAERAPAEDGGETAYLRWVFICEIKGKRHEIEGMSEVLFSRRHLVLSHTDHWDAAEQFYEHIPVLGGVIRWVKNRNNA